MINFEDIQVGEITKFSTTLPSTPNIHPLTSLHVSPDIHIFVCFQTAKGEHFSLNPRILKNKKAI